MRHRSLFKGRFRILGKRQFWVKSWLSFNSDKLFSSKNYMIPVAIVKYSVLKKLYDSGSRLNV